MNFDIAAQSSPSSSEHAAQRTPSSPEQRHAEFENISFRVHEKAGFEKSGVSPAREYHWLADSGEYFPDARSCTHFDAEVR